MKTTQTSSNKNFLFRNQKGMALISVMIAAGIAGIIALGIGQVMTNMVNSVDNVQKTVDIQDAVMAAKMAMVDPANCTASIADFTGTTFDASLVSDGFITQNIKINKFKTAAGITLLEKNTHLKGLTKSKINEISLLNLQPVNQSTGLFLADVQFDVDKGGVGLGVQRIQRKFPLILEATNTSGTNFQISKCYGSSANSIQDIKNILAQTCTSQGGVFVMATSICQFTNALCTAMDINTCFGQINTTISALQEQVTALKNPLNTPPSVVVATPPASSGYFGPPSISSGQITLTTVYTGNGSTNPFSVNASPCAVGATYSGYYNCGPWVPAPEAYMVCDTWTQACNNNPY